MASAELMEPIVQAVLELSPERTAETVEAALRAGALPLEIVDDGIVRGMEGIGESYQRQEVHLPELLMAEQCIRSGLDVIEEFESQDGARLADAARRRLSVRAASWMPALSSCVTRLLHSSDSFLRTTDDQ
jgi:methanogenic corrinoid protein MtbC1